MARERKGSFTTKDNKLYARISWIDEHSGKRRELYKQVPNRTEGKRWMKEQLRDLEDHGKELLDAQKLTFEKLAKEYQRLYVQKAKYSTDDRKLSGMRSHASVNARIKPLIDHFGRMRVRSITHRHLEEYQKVRLDTPCIYEKKTRPRKDKPQEVIRMTERPRSITSVNRELEIMRAMMRFAVREGWITKNPFDAGTGLISKASERERERILSRLEESALLAQCVGHYAYLRPIIITAVDTAMRKGEIFQLLWSDVDFAGRVIKVRGFTTKTMEPRTIGMTTRVLNELTKLWEASEKDDSRSVFESEHRVKKSFPLACKVAGIEGMRFHDLRHTAITRMVMSGMPPIQIMKISGHSQMQTFTRYVNNDGHSIRLIADALEQFNSIPVLGDDVASQFIN